MELNKIKRITNTQYLVIGCYTNVGIVKVIHDNKTFTTTDGWSHILDIEIVYLIDYN